MSRRLLSTVSAALLFAVASLCVALPPGDEKEPSWRALLPAQELGPLAEQVAAALKKPIKALMDGKLDDDDRERAVKKARGLALLLAAGALATDGKGAEAARRAPLCNAALQLDRSLRAGKFADASAVLAALPAGTGFEKPAFTPTPLIEVGGRDDALAALMVQFRLRSLGGLGIEPVPRNKMQDGLDAMLKVVGDTGDGGLKPDELARFAYRLAVMAEATRSLPPPRPTVGKDPAQWLQWSAEMRVASLKLADAALARNRTAIRQAALKVNKNCTDCHRVFRDN